MVLYEFQASHSSTVRPCLKTTITAIKTDLFVSVCLCSYTQESTVSAHTESTKGTGCLPPLSTCSFEAGVFPEPEAITGSLQALPTRSPHLLSSLELGLRSVQDAPSRMLCWVCAS